MHHLSPHTALENMPESVLALNKMEHATQDILYTATVNPYVPIPK